MEEKSFKRGLLKHFYNILKKILKEKIEYQESMFMITRIGKLITMLLHQLMDFVGLRAMGI